MPMRFDLLQALRLLRDFFLLRLMPAHALQ
jgi:hypothetical protein